jgi:hypothetical protein
LPPRRARPLIGWNALQTWPVGRRWRPSKT